jgi:hypothetical protein
VVGVSVYDATPSQVFTLQTSVIRTNIERPAVERAALNILTYGVTSISKTCRVFYFAARFFGRFSILEETRRLKDRQIAAQLRPGNFGTECWKDSHRRAQYASVDIVVNSIPEGL